MIKLSKFEKIFDQLLESYNLIPKKEEVSELLNEIILGKIKDFELPDLLVSQLKISFTQATDFAYDLKTNITDKQKDLADIKKELEIKQGSRFYPDKIANEFLNKLNFPIADPNIKKRYEEAILSWLKEIRDIPELKEVLTKSEKIGGVNMSEPVFNQLYDLLVSKKEEIKKANIDLGKIIAEYEAKQNKEASPSEIREEEIDVSARALKIQRGAEKPTGSDVTIDQLLADKGITYGDLAKKDLSQLQRFGPERERMDSAPASLAEEIKAKEASFAKASEAIKEENLLVEEIEAREEFLESTEEIPPPARPEPETIQAQTVQPQTRFEVKQPMISKPLSVTRPKVEDVKFSAQLYGPIDELGAVKIEDFRRLSKNPDEAARKIMGKIELLEEESMVKRNEGVKALKSSPLYKAYAQIMNTAIKQGQSFNQIIEANPIITLAEFKAIMDLNKSLKF